MRQRQNEGKKAVKVGGGGDERSNADGSVWPRSGLQVQSYYRKLSIWKNLIRREGQIFQSTKVFQ